MDLYSASRGDVFEGTVLIFIEELQFSWPVCLVLIVCGPQTNVGTYPLRQKGALLTFYSSFVFHNKMI